jgi:hypothetical protein
MPRCAAGEYLFSMLKAGSISIETVFPTPTCQRVLSCCYTMHTCHPCWRLHHTATRTPRHAAHMPHTCAAAGEGRAIVLHARHLGRGCSAWPQLLAASCVGVVAPAQGPPEPHAPWLRGLFVMHKLGTYTQQRGRYYPCGLLPPPSTAHNTHLLHTAHVKVLQEAGVGHAGRSNARGVVRLGSCCWEQGCCCPRHTAGAWVVQGAKGQKNAHKQPWWALEARYSCWLAR